MALTQDIGTSVAICFGKQFCDSS